MLQLLVLIEKLLLIVIVIVIVPSAIADVPVLETTTDCGADVPPTDSVPNDNGPGAIVIDD